jgi:RNA polymerase sigma factor (sigma-70 family)
MSAEPGRAETEQTFWQDQSLVQECLKGSEEAWSTLIDKYKNLIFSIPVKYGFSSEDATDIFQMVCLSLLSHLPRLREPRALAAWLIQTTAHNCFRWQTRRERQIDVVHEQNVPGEAPKIPDEILRDLEREQLLRDAVAELSGDCRRLVELLFFQSDSLSYDEIAGVLGIPKGSVGPTRMRCLEKLRQSLEKKGF